MITAEQLSEVHLLHRDRDMHFCVQPRYTLGNPGVVDQGVALALARSEIKVYHQALKGLWGHEDCQRAAVVGLDGISLLRVEMPRNWRVYDLITLQSWDEEFVGQGVLTDS